MRNNSVQLVVQGLMLGLCNMPFLRSYTSLLCERNFPAIRLAENRSRDSRQKVILTWPPWPRVRPKVILTWVTKNRADDVKPLVHDVMLLLSWRHWPVLANNRAEMPHMALVFYSIFVFKPIHNKTIIDWCLRSIPVFIDPRITISVLGQYCFPRVYKNRYWPHHQSIIV